MPRAARLLLLGLLALAPSACITRPIRQDVYSKGTVEVYLRSEKRGLSLVKKGYDHPLTIAPVRVAHILSRLDMRPSSGKAKERLPAIPTDLLYSIADGVSQAFGDAGPDQDVVVMAIRREKRWGIFEHKYLTSFVAYARDGRVYLHLNRSEWEIPKRREDRLPEPSVGDHPMSFHLYPSYAMVLVDPQSVAVDWQDPIFAKDTRTKILPTGEVVRRTILLESPPEEISKDAGVALPDDLSPEQLRALADLEEKRRSGEITEGAYLSERRRILNPGSESDLAIPGSDAPGSGSEAGSGPESGSSE